MGRVATNKVNYLSVDCDFFQKEKMFAVMASLGELAQSRALRLLLWMGRTEGLFIEFNEMTAARFASQELCNINAAEEVAELIRRLVEIGFFNLYEDEDGKKYLSSPSIIRDWKEITKKAKRTVNLERLPKVILAELERIGIDSEGKGIDSEGKAEKRESIPQRKEKKSNKQTNKQANIQNEFFPEEFHPEWNLPEVSDPEWNQVRAEVTQTLWNRGISSDLIDMAAAAVLRGWLSLDQLKRVRSLADRKVVQASDSNGRLGNDRYPWQGIAEQVFAVFREHGEDPPPCSAKRLEPKPTRRTDPVRVSGSARKERDPKAVGFDKEFVARCRKIVACPAKRKEVEVGEQQVQRGCR